jgi:hypothetical protein
MSHPFYRPGSCRVLLSAALSSQLSANECRSCAHSTNLYKVKPHTLFPYALLRKFLTIHRPFTSTSISLRFDLPCAPALHKTTESLPASSNPADPTSQVECSFGFGLRTYSPLGQPVSTFWASSHSPKHLKQVCGQPPYSCRPFTPPKPNLYCR